MFAKQTEMPPGRERREKHVSVSPVTADRNGAPGGGPGGAAGLVQPRGAGPGLGERAEL